MKSIIQFTPTTIDNTNAQLGRHTAALVDALRAMKHPVLDLNT